MARGRHVGVSAAKPTSRAAATRCCSLAHLNPCRLSRPTPCCSCSPVHALSLITKTPAEAGMA